MQYGELIVKRNFFGAIQNELSNRRGIDSLVFAAC